MGVRISCSATVTDWIELPTNLHSILCGIKLRFSIGYLKLTSCVTRRFFKKSVCPESKRSEKQVFLKSRYREPDVLKTGRRTASSVTSAAANVTREASRLTHSGDIIGVIPPSYTHDCLMSTRCTRRSKRTNPRGGRIGASRIEVQAVVLVS